MKRPYYNQEEREWIHNKDMKKIKVDQETIKKYVKQFKNCSEAQTMLRSDFPEVFKSELPKTWAEFCEIKNIEKRDNYLKYLRFHKTHDKEIMINFWEKDKIYPEDGIMIPDKFVALRKLEKLRDHYNDGWKSEVRDYRYCLEKENNKVIKEDWYIVDRFLAFKTPELRDEFLTNFKELIISAEDLI